MTLGSTHEPLTRDKPTCHFCGRKFDLGYHYTCHICGATYCYIHMSRHVRAHRTPTHQPETPASTLAQAPSAQVLTSDPEEIDLVRSYLMGLLGQGEVPDSASL